MASARCCKAICSLGNRPGAERKIDYEGVRNAVDAAEAAGITRFILISSLGCGDPGATDEELRAAHRNLVRTYHPDRLVSKGLPEEFMKLANDRLAEINSAYETVRKHRRAP